MELRNAEWASFYNEAIESFSEEFQAEMSRQLSRKFDLMIGIENYARDNEFQLLVGLESLKINFQDGYAFCLVEVVDRYSFASTVTAYWKASTIDNKVVMNSNELNAANIEFGWCADFNKEKLLKNEESKLVGGLQNEGLGFRCTVNFTLYPDISYTFKFKEEPNKTDLRQINEFMKSNFKNSSISEITGSGKIFTAAIDFQGTNIEDGIIEIDEFMRSYISCDLKKKTESISIN